MGNRLYARLAFHNIKRNRQTYLPYIITCIITTAMLYIIRSLAVNEGLDSMRGGYALRDILALGSHITRIFAFIFLFYTNSFLMKHRKKEFGLFNILGMEKRHIARVLFIETLFTAVISLSFGIGLGILLDKLMFLSLTKLLGGDVQLGFYISPESIIVIAVFMLVTLLLIYLNALRQIQLAKPIELLHGSNVGEKEPKTKWLMAILGVTLIGTGYYISIVTTQPLKALTLFFVAVLCVVLGTYCLFIAGSIALLKLLKKNKRYYYYRTSHFTTVSGMIYRMKQNAVGLANICILSTMVLVMISSTSSLVAGIDDIIKNRYPYEFLIASTDDTMQEDLGEYLSENKVDVERERQYTSLTFEVQEEGGRYYIPEVISSSAIDELCGLMAVPLEDFNRVMKKDFTLQDGEVLFYCSDKKTSPDKLDIMGRKYTVAQKLDRFLDSSEGIVKNIYIVVKDKEELQWLDSKQTEAYGEHASSIHYNYDLDIASGDEELLRADLIRFFSDSGIHYIINTKYGAYEEAMSLYGGLFFLGAFLGTLFLMQTILIIYYKQVSEGYDDKKRFEIMQNVGMSRAEVKKSIHSQIITVFFLPLMTAGIHVGFAFPLIRRLLLMFSMTNTLLYAACLLASFGAFAAIYAVIYWLTARTYYKIVSK